MGLFNSNFYTLKSAMDVSMLRQEIHSQNLANAETPGYKRRYVVFESILQKVIDERNIKLNTTNSKHIGLYRTPVKPVVMRDMLTSYRNDGNNVDVDVEVVEMVKNGLKYQAFTKLLNMNIDRYNTVLRGVR